MEEIIMTDLSASTRTQRLQVVPVTSFSSEPSMLITGFDRLMKDVVKNGAPIVSLCRSPSSSVD